MVLDMSFLKTKTEMTKIKLLEFKFLTCYNLYLGGECENCIVEDDDLYKKNSNGR